MVNLNAFPLSQTLLQSLSLSTPVNITDLLRALALTWDAAAVKTQSETEKHIDRDPTYIAFKKSRTLLQQAPYFSEYRKINRRYNEAACRVHDGGGSMKDVRWVNGLDAEIAQSSTVAPIGLQLLYGHGFRGPLLQPSI